MNKKIGVVHGRMQPLHLGHMEYILAAKSKCDFLIIGISNPDNLRSKLNKFDASRSEESSNPFTFFERLQMIQNTLIKDYGFKFDEFSIVPFPIDTPELINFYIPFGAKYYLTIYDKWGEFKVSTLKKIGFETEVLWIRTMADRFTSGTIVRDRIRMKKKWESLVPKEVSNYIKVNKLDLKV